MESNDIRDIPDRGETSEEPSIPLGQHNNWNTSTVIGKTKSFCNRKTLHKNSWHLFIWHTSKKMKFHTMLKMSSTGIAPHHIATDELFHRYLQSLSSKTPQGRSERFALANTFLAAPLTLGNILASSDRCAAHTPYHNSWQGNNMVSKVAEKKLHSAYSSFQFT